MKALAKSMNLDENQIDGEYYILISVNPFDKVPFGDIDPEEIPPRHPNAHANYNIELFAVSSLNSNYSGGNYLVVGKVDFKGNIAQVNTPLYSALYLCSKSSCVDRLLQRIRKIHRKSAAVCIQNHSESFS